MLLKQLRKRCSAVGLFIEGWILAYPVCCQSCRRVNPLTAVERFVSRC
jgi:hypothetical protein